MKTQTPTPMKLRDQVQVFQVQELSVDNPKGENDKRAKSLSVIMDWASSWVRIDSRLIMQSLSESYLYENIKFKNGISEKDQKIILGKIKGIFDKEIKEVKDNIKSIKDFFSILLLGEQAIFEAIKMKIAEELVTENSIYQESLSRVSDSQKIVNQLSIQIILFMQAEVNKFEAEGAFMYDSLRVLMMSLLSLSIVPIHQSILSILRYLSESLTAFFASTVDSMQTVSVEAVNDTISDAINDTMSELNEEMCGLDEVEGSDMPFLIAFSLFLGVILGL